MLNCAVGGSVPPKSDTYLVSAPLIHTFVSLHVMTYTPGDAHTSSISQRALHAYPSRFVLCLLWPSTYESFFQYKNFCRDEFPGTCVEVAPVKQKKNTFIRFVTIISSKFQLFYSCRDDHPTAATPWTRATHIGSVGKCASETSSASKPALQLLMLWLSIMSSCQIVKWSHYEP